MINSLKSRAIFSCAMASFVFCALVILAFALPAWSQCTSCENCPPPVVEFTSKQISLNGTQDLAVSSGAGGPYNWAIIRMS